MQTKKRAKPVKFGSKKEKKQPLEPKKIEKDTLKDEKQETEVVEIEAVNPDEVDEKEAVEDVEVVEAKDEEEKEEKKSVLHKEEIVEESSTDEAVDFFTKPPDVEVGSKKGAFIYFLTVFLVTFLIGIGLFAGIYYVTSGNQINLFPKPTEVPPTPTPIIEMPVEVDLQAYSIEVLNGSGVTGAAGDAQEALEEEGFKVDSVGNADSTDFELTKITAAEKVDKEYLQKLTEFLKKTYSIDEDIEKAENDTDVTIIIGTEKTP